MRLSLIFELLLIFVLLAFAASAAVVDSRALSKGRKSSVTKRRKVTKNRQDAANKYCSCSSKLCNCCREFNIPVVALQGPGCASLQYLKGDRLAISMSFGERILTNTTISSRKPKPVCMPLPGGVSKFCGRVYNIGRKGADFNACLGLELRALEDVEAAVRVACFRFGPQGLRVEPSQPLPVVDDENEADDDDDDDDEDEDDEDVEYDDDDNDVDSSDYETFSVFGDDFIGSFFAGGDSDSEDTKPVKKVTTTTKAPLRKVTRKPTKVATTSTTKRRKVTTPRPTKTTSKVEKIPETTAKPLMENLSIPAAATNQSEVIVPNEKDPSPPHESIAAVTAMLQELPAGAISQMPVTVDGKPLQAGPIPAPVQISSTLTENQAVAVESASKNVTAQGITVTAADKFETTTMMDAVTTEEEDDESPSQSFIVKSEEEEDDPVADAVEDVLGDDDSKENKKDKKNKIKGEKQESGEIVDDILEGVAETITFDDGESDNKKNGTATSEASNEDEDDDVDDDDDEEDDDDSEDEDDEESRKAGEHFGLQKKGRKSRVMWLDRLHW